MDRDFESLTIADYAKQAAYTDHKQGSRALGFLMLGLFGETGSLLSEAKKKQRDEASYLGYANAVAEELGDVLWYLAAITRRNQLALQDIAAAAVHDDSKWSTGVNEDLTFHALQPTHMPLAKAPTPTFEATLLALGGEVGTLIHDFRPSRFRGQSLTGDSDLDSRLTFGGSLGRADWRDRRGMGSDRAVIAA